MNAPVSDKKQATSSQPLSDGPHSAPSSSESKYGALGSSGAAPAPKGVEERTGPSPGPDDNPAPNPSRGWEELKRLPSVIEVEEAEEYEAQPHPCPPCPQPIPPR